MGKYLDAYVAYMDRKGIKYTVRDERAVDIVYNADNASSIKVTVRFDKEDDGRVHFVSYAIGGFKGKEDAAIRICNEKNKDYRWVKFYIDDDSDVVVDSDTICDLVTVGDECHELVQRMVSIVDKSYPDFMKARWA